MMATTDNTAVDEIDIDADFIVNEKRIVRLKLIGLFNSRTPIIVYLHDKRGISELIDVSSENEIILDRVITLTNLKANDELYLEANPDGVKCHFKCRVLANDADGLVLAWPEPFYWINYREYHRVNLTAAHSARCFINMDDDYGLVPFSLVNISLTGFAVQVHAGLDIALIMELLDKHGVQLEINGALYRINVNPRYHQKNIIGCSMKIDVKEDHKLDQAVQKLINAIEFDKISRKKGRK
jgi:hypothetical protein